MSTADGMLRSLEETLSCLPFFRVYVDAFLLPLQKVDGNCVCAGVEVWTFFFDEWGGSQMDQMSVFLGMIVSIEEIKRLILFLFIPFFGSE